MKYVVALGRFLFAFIFIYGSKSDFSTQAVAHAAAEGVPLPQVLVPLAAVIAILGALSVIFGFKAKYGAWLLVLFLVPVTLLMHAFWKASDPMLVQLQQVNFLKNLSMLGGALLIAYFGAGPLSIDAILNGRKARLR